MTGVGAAHEGAQLCAAMCAGTTLLLSTGHRRDLRRARLLLAADSRAVAPFGSSAAGWPAETIRRLRERWPTRFGAVPGRELLCIPIGCVIALLGASVLPLLGGFAAVPVIRWWLRARRRRRDRERRAAAVIRLCVTVAGELRGGRQPSEALLSAPAEGLEERWGLVTAAARFGGDVPDALRRVAGLPGAEGLGGIAACWRVAVDGGAGLAAALDRVAAALRAERDRREDLSAQLAAPRATALVLAVLPVVGLLMGWALGVAPLRILLHTPAGLGCLAAGGLLEWAGLAWTARVVRAAAGPEGPVADDR